MNRNSQTHFATTPTVGIGRSKFDRSFTHKTAFDAGRLIPFYVDCTIMPGDTVKMNTSEVVRMLTPITPVMDNANLDTYFFFVPYRLIWEHFKAFFGENETAPWKQTVQYEIPQIVAPATTGWTMGSLADYMGFPTEVPGYEASALPFRAYCLIYNEFFRSENLQNPVYIYKGDTTVTGVDITKPGGPDPVTDTELGAQPLNVCKYFDYFTGALPEAQKGDPVLLPLGETAPLIYAKYDTTTPAAMVGEGFRAYTRSYSNSQYNITPVTGGDQDSVYWTLEADLKNATGATINQLRQAFAIQRFYEKSALYGSRYIEFVKGHFQVTNPDFRLQRPEYLGGMQTPININQVVAANQTQSEITYISGQWGMRDLPPQGNTAAYSLTSGKNDGLFTHSFTEHGILMGLCCVRTVHTYQQGLDRQYSMKKWTDFYVPEFANLGNDFIRNKEIFLQGPSVVDTDGNVVDEQAFGYQEAWAHYRYKPDIVTGAMRSNYAQSLDIWHWADDYATLPSLGDKWIQEGKENIARTLAVQNQPQFQADFYFQAIYTRPMPLYSVPGLIDHH